MFVASTQGVRVALGKKTPIRTPRIRIKKKKKKKLVLLVSVLASNTSGHNKSIRTNKLHIYLAIIAGFFAGTNFVCTSTRHQHAGGYRSKGQYIRKLFRIKSYYDKEKKMK